MAVMKMWDAATSTWRVVGTPPHSHNAVAVPDKRSQAFTPAQYETDGADQTTRWEFISGTSLGLTQAYYGVQTIAPWTDDTGGGMTQIATGPDGVWTRYGTRGGGWGAWKPAANVDTGWVVPTFENAWVTYGPGHDARYRRMNGIVYLQGLVKSGTLGATVYTLPVGYRPVQTQVVTAKASGGAYRIDAITDGRVIIYNEALGAPTTAWVSTAMSFPADQ